MNSVTDIFSKLDFILPSVERPSRYTGGEWNSRPIAVVGKTSDETLADICLCYPDLYEIGSSAPGMEILYSVVNLTGGKFSASRCFAPKEDFFKGIKKNNIPLFSLEDGKALVDFDVVGFTLQHELSITNVLYMMDAAGIPFRSKDRLSENISRVYPLIVGGGPLTLNPEPFADFFDVIIVGDGEEALIEVMKIIAENKQKTSCSRIKEHIKSRYALLEEIAKSVKGAYVPVFYEPVYDEKGFYQGLKKNISSAPEVIYKRIYDIRKSPSSFYDSPVVPNSATVQGRLVVEIARGCPHRCSFCSARIYYGPWRLRSKEQIIDMIKNGLKNTGYDEVSFASLSSGDYPGILELLKAMSTSAISPYPISLGIPSIHCQKFTSDLAHTIAHISASRPTLTFAPETGSERLRFSIGKKITNESIFSCVSAARDAGWKQAKFYFMYGLPGETDEDILSIPTLVRELRRNFRDFGIKISLSPFVPKPHTIFEKERFDNIDSLYAKFSLLRKNLGGAAHTHQIEASFIEALISRGDRRLSTVIERAYKKGAKFDQWTECFSYEKWMKSFEEESIDPVRYVNRFCESEGNLEKILPWSHIVPEGTQQTFLNETFNNKSLEIMSSNFSDKYDFDKSGLKTSESVSKNSSPAYQRSLRFRVRMSRQGLARFISNNDQIEIIRRSVRRARLPVVYSSGFHPQPKISFGPAISVGYESMAEYFEVELSRYISPQEILDRLNSFLPQGYRVNSVKQVPTMFASLESLCAAVEYSARIIDIDTRRPLLDKESENFFSRKINEYLSGQQTVIETGDGKQVDIRTLVRNVGIEIDKRNTVGEEEFVLRVIVNIIPGKNIKVEKIIRHILSIPDDRYVLRITREKFFYIKKKDNTIVEI